MTSKRTLFCSALLALALMGGTTACGGSDDDTKAGSTDSTSSSSASASSDGASPSGKATDANGNDGGVDFKTTKGLPKDYPSDEVPLIDGKVLGASQGAFKPSGAQVKGWTVRVQTGKSVKATLADATAKLKAAGFKPIKDPDLGSTQAALEDDTYDVRLLASAVQKKKSKKTKGAVVIYTVTFA
jgi:hypothetical protein